MAISLLDIFFSIAPFPTKLFKAFDYLAGGTIAFLLPSNPRKKFPDKVKSILIIRPGGIGDAVFLLPILKALKDQGLVIDILCEQRNAEVFTSQGLRRVSLQEVFFNDTIYDVVIDTEQWHYLSALTAYLARSSYKIGFATRPQRAKLFHKAVKYDVDGYELDNFWRLFVILSETKDLNDRESKESHQLKVEGSFSINAHAQAWAKEQIPDNFVAVFLGASIVLRRLNEGQIMTIVNYYLRKNCTIVLLGGKDVKSFAQGITTKIVNSLPLCGEGKGEGNKIFNYAGQLSLMQSAALIQRSSLFIGPDSGFLHLACAINTPVIGIFGPGNLVKWAPKGEKHRVITENAACSPCTRFGYTLPTCNGSYHCMKNIKIRQFDVIPAKAGIHNRINSSLNEKL